MILLTTPPLQKARHPKARPPRTHAKNTHDISSVWGRGECMKIPNPQSQIPFFAGRGSRVIISRNTSCIVAGCGPWAAIPDDRPRPIYKTCVPRAACRNSSHQTRHKPRKRTRLIKGVFVGLRSFVASSVAYYGSISGRSSIPSVKQYVRNNL